MKHYYRTSIDASNALRSDFDQQAFLNSTDKAHDPVSIWAFRGSDVFDVFNKEWIRHVEQNIGMEVSFALLFYRVPYNEFEEVHVDLDPDRGNIQSTYSLNFVNDDLDDSSMLWYDIPIETGEFKYTPAMTPYVSWPTEEVRHLECDRYTIGKQLTLVNVGQPHNVITGSRTRWCYCLRFKDPNIFSWEQAVKHFSNLIIE